MSSIYSILRNILFKFDAETAHKLSLNTLKFTHQLGINNLLLKKPNNLPKKVMGLNFPNPVGLAAGLDKNADYIDALGDFGFGFIEVGTVTPKPQIGNSKPRLFRLPEKHALINRMGFNNKGISYFVERLKERTYKGILGASITQNNDAKTVDDGIQDYCSCFRSVYPYVDYVSVDVSCPNVKTEINFQEPELLKTLILRLQAERDTLQGKVSRYVPIAIKISPDVADEEIDAIVQVLLACKVDAVIATNTTRKRPHLSNEKLAAEKGGLSGAPLFNLSIAVVDKLHERLQDNIPIIAVGGIMSAHDATKMFEAGASLVQIYSGLIYHGPQLIHEIIETLYSSPTV